MVQSVHCSSCGPGLFQLEPGPSPAVCPLWLALPLLLLDELAACRPNGVQNALNAFGWLWQLWLASTFQAFGSAWVPGCPVTFVLSLSLGVPGILFSPLPTTCSPTKPQAPALICVQKKCVLLERAGRTLSSHYLALKGDYYVFCGWQREREGKIPPPDGLFDVPLLPGSNNVPFSWRS